MTQEPGPCFAPLAEVGAMIRDAGLSPVELADRCLRRIEALNPRLNAFITVTAALAREQARQAQSDLRAGRWRGPLHGVPVAIKDFYDTAGIRTTAAFEAFRDRTSSRDADLVVRLREAGAVLVGKTNMHRLGMGTTSLDSAFGAVVNPWGTGHVAGGSSGGSAVAVAAGLCFATVDTDAIGSTRLPAAICGVSGFKPTFGTLSAAGILAGEPVDPTILLLGHPGITARSADDVRLAFSTLTGVSLAEAPRIRRVGAAANYRASRDTRAAFEAAVAVLPKLGIEPVEVAIPFEAASFDTSHIGQDRAAINETLFGGIEAILLPTLTASTPTVEAARDLGDTAVSADNTFFCNYFGLPAISVPCGADANGLPLGLQIVGPWGGDHLVLSLASAWQEAAGWSYIPPEGLT